jgi:GNAT superfamily N-acetyltransferase
MRSADLVVRDVDGDRWFDRAAELLRLVVPAPCAGLTPYDSDRFGRFLAAAHAVPRPHRTLLLRGVYLGDDLAGVADWRLLGSTLFLNGVAVVPTWRRNGLGRRLVLDGVEMARGLGCVAVELDVAADNAAAATLYERLGFADVGGSAWTLLGDPTAWAAPEAGSTTWRLADWPAFVAHHTAYGFGDVSVRGGEIAVTVRVLPGAWRLGAALDPEVLASLVRDLAGTVPTPDRVFVVTGADFSEVVGTRVALFRRLRLEVTAGCGPAQGDVTDL